MYCVHKYKYTHTDMYAYICTYAHIINITCVYCVRKYKYTYTQICMLKYIHMHT